MYLDDENLSIQIRGHVLIKDENGEVLLDKNNAIHNKNMAIAFARGLSDSSNSQIFKIKFGNGGSLTDSLNQITYSAPNVTGPTANLYNATYAEIVDGKFGAPAENSVSYQQSISPAETTIVIISCTISANEPNGQAVSDSAVTGVGGAKYIYAFDELGLFTNDNPVVTTPPLSGLLQGGLLLSHIVFTPILKTANREMVVTYTLTISVS